MPYLLSTEALLDLVKRGLEGDVGAWSKQISPDQVSISVISIGQIRSQIEDLPSSDPDKDPLRRNLARIIAGFEREDRIRNVDRRVVERWALIRPLLLIKSGNVSLGPDTKLVIATALVNDLTFVAEDELWTDVLRAHGLVIMAPPRVTAP